MRLRGVFTAALIDSAAAEVHLASGEGGAADGEVDLALEVAVLEGVARQGNLGAKLQADRHQRAGKTRSEKHSEAPV